MTEKPHTIDKYIEQVILSRQKGHFGSKEKILFFKELSYLLKGGVSIIDAITTMRDTADNLAIKDMTQYIYTKLNEGKSLTYSLARLPKYFTDGDVSIIKSGEKSGRLVTVLASLSNEYTFLGKIKSQYIGAMIYPVILLVVSLVAVLALFIFILPGIFDIVTEFDGAQIPQTTQMMMNFSHFLNDNITTLSVILVIVVILGSLFLSTSSGKKSFFSFLSSVPLIGKMTTHYQLIKFSRYTKLMLEAGLTYREVFILQKDIMRQPQYQEMIDDVLDGLDKGESIFTRIKEHDNIIPSNVLVLLKVGEETATLKESLDNIIQMYEEELRNLINNVSKVIEPVLIVFVGGIIALVALSVFGIIGTVLDTLPAM